MKSHKGPDGNDAHKRAIEQAKAGYQNAQETIRFIDTKTSFVAGASTVSIGFVLDALKEYIQLPNALRNNFDLCPKMTCWIAILAVASLLAGVLCLWQSILSLVARPPKMDNRSTVLFPFFFGNRDERLYCKKLLSGFTDYETAQEYEIQIWNVGLILQRKVTRHRWAGWILLCQLIAITVAGILIVFCLYYGYVLQ